MGHRLNMDGKCVVCKKYTDFFCDACDLNICETHQKKKDSGSPLEPYILCPSCFKKDAKVKSARKGFMLRHNTM